MRQKKTFLLNGSFKNATLHADCGEEACQLLREKLNHKNVYYMNPAIDM